MKSKSYYKLDFNPDSTRKFKKLSEVVSFIENSPLPYMYHGSYVRHYRSDGLIYKYLVHVSFGRCGYAVDIDLVL